MFKAQVSTEYLVILAVVLVVALVVVALVSGVTPVSSGVSETQSRNYWVAAAPIAIKNWKYSGTTLELSIESVESTRITLTDISIEGSSVYSANTSFGVGEKKAITASGLPDCGIAGESFELNDVMITYTKGATSGIIVKGEKPIVGKCS